MRFAALCLLAGTTTLGSGAAAADSTIRQFDFGAFHRCALGGDGAVQCLGESNVFGQIGSGTPGEQGAARPVTVIGHGASKVVTGSFYSCAIVGGALRCWGDIGGKDPGKPRALISSGVTDAAAGDDRVCAIVGDAAQCVGVGGQSGSNEYSQLHPVPYTEIEHGVRAIAVGHMHACAVAGDALLCWGDVPFDASDQRGRVTRSALPVRVIEHGVSAVAAGEHHDCAIADGALWCWGDNTHGQIGIGRADISAAALPDVAVPPTKVHKAKHSTQSPRSNLFDDGVQRCSAPGGRVDACWVSRPVKVIEHGVTRVFAKGDASCALVEGALQCWGANALGQLGLSGEQVDTPQTVFARSVGEVALSATRACALVDGALQCTRRCLDARDGSPCRADPPGFTTSDLAFGVSDREARLGVWRGTIGTQPIMLCLRRAPADDSSYYYLRHRSTIALRSADFGGAKWQERMAEDNSTGSWELAAAHGDTMSGTWSDADATRTLPIRLSRVPVKGDPGAACGQFESDPQQDAYNAPRVDAEPLSTTTAADGSRTVRARGNQLSVVELPDSAPHAGAFNAAMRNWLREQIVAYFDCASATRAGDKVDFNQQREFELRAGAWVVVRESFELYCGGAYPNGGVGYETWNLEDGKPADLWSWIRDSKRKCDYSSDCGSAAPDALNTLLLELASRNKDGDECADAVNENRSYGLRPSRTGLVFTTSFAHVIQACDEDIEVPYAKVEPFLTDLGRQQLKGLIEAASQH